jgi:hypothetical protein
MRLRLGGPLRTPAAEFDCRVAGLDLTWKYWRSCDDAFSTDPAKARTDYRHDDALDMPFLIGPSMSHLLSMRW